MRIFVAGATGVLGRRVVARLVAEGHDVTAVARSADKAALVRSLGATPVSADLFDPDAVAAAVAGHDVVCNLATSIPPAAKAMRASAWTDNDRLRTEASHNLVAAALAAGATRYIQESLAFAYPDSGERWLDEDTPLAETAVTRGVRAAEAAAQRMTDAGGAGVVLRFGAFYGHDSHTSRDRVRAVRVGVAPFLGDPDGYEPAIDTDDAAAAVVAALQAPAGVYNVVDDEPLTKREHAAVLAAAIGQGRVRFPPRKLGDGTWPGTEALSHSQRVSNRRFRQATGWAPARRSVRDGVPPMVAAVDRHSGGRAPIGLGARALLAVLALGGVTIGAWAQLAPASFYDGFPLGRGWVAADGPFNEHLLRDFGGLNVAVAVLLGAAAVIGTRAMARIAAVASSVYAAPHLAYHLAHLDPYDGVDAVGNVVTLGLAVAGPLAVLWLVRDRRVPAGAPAEPAVPSATPPLAAATPSP